ncbi:MAG: hypothetical protein H7Y00_02430, partial [Fimbriimonadaceae bacterium]|nr:hypothetical protein [Chitinophagales bacterium]
MKKTLLLTILAFSFSVFLITKTNAQLAGTSVFLQGQYVEVGISECGVHGTAEEPPTGPYGEYHGINTNGLGFIADHEKDGWDASIIGPNFCGDYFTPGSPEEGWAIQYGSYIYENHYVGCSGYGGTDPGTADIPGSIISYTDTLGIKTAVWEGTLVDGDLDITIQQSTILPDTALFFILEVKITNNSATDLIDFYYTYNVDPDQDVDFCGDYSTTNTIVNNFPLSDTAQVTALGIACGCFFSLSSLDERARVSYGNFYISPATPAGAWAGDTGEGYSNTGTTDCDCAVQISYKLDIAAGATETVYYARAFMPEASPMALTYIHENLETPFEIFAGGADITEDGAAQICSGSSIDLEIESSDEYIWTWEPATYLSTSTGTSVTATPLETITYTLTGTSTDDILYTTININVIPEIELSLLSSASLSDEPTGTASASVIAGGLEPFTYVWSNGETTE